MPDTSDLQAEAYARHHLMKSGIVATLKESQLFIWHIVAYKDRLSISIDTSKNPSADMGVIQDELAQFLTPLQRIIQIKDRPIEGNCCYGVCHGCINGDPDVHPLWIGPPPSST